uniref:BTB domain-containing protein n=1 Tax=Mycena chlorophos TaxID=658473 RepID=A0ABQ0KVK2_MYCCL|nr:predicted protein [Mycena chlorophos]
MDTSDLERVESLWFSDGNVVLQAGNVQFRVYSGLLAQKSRVFADLLACPQPEEDSVIEGCPVMHLDDSAADTLYFLKAVFDYEFFPPYPAHTDFDAIHGVLKLSTKYDVQPLRTRALQHLSSVHPSSLTAWDALCSPSSLSFTPPAYAGPSFDASNLELPIITLARATHAQWILPVAFYRALSTLSASDILDGIDYTAVHVELQKPDKVLLLEAGPVVLGEPTADILGFLWSPTVIPGCESSGASSSGIMNSCTANRLMMRVAAERWRSDALALLPICVSVGNRDDGIKTESMQGEGDATKSTEEEQEGRAIWSEDDFSRLDVCGPCLTHMKADWSARRAQFWERLPSLFGLPAWEELERQRMQEIGW